MLQDLKTLIYIYIPSSLYLALKDLSHMGPYNTLLEVFLLLYLLEMMVAHEKNTDAYHHPYLLVVLLQCIVMCLSLNLLHTFPEVSHRGTLEPETFTSYTISSSN
jgi:hypothetical protein